jgi:glycyl-tRNA synthetase beta chain
MKVENRNSKIETRDAEAGSSFEFLLEVGCEEIPARFLRDAERGLGERVRVALKEARLLPEVTVGAVREAPLLRTYSTPRRLIVHLPALLARQPDKVEEVLGPPVKVAIDAEGKYTRAAESFAQKNSAKLEDLIRATTPKGEYLALRKTTQGRSAQAVLAEVLPAAILGLSFPKSMYWTAKSDPRFVRPIRWVLAILGEGKQALAVDFEVLGVKSGNFTFGHRAKSRQSLPVKDFKDYTKKLARQHVEIDPARRRQRILDEIEALLESASLKLVPDEWLLDWIVNSTEWPRAMLGNFDKRFLRLPREILITVMRDHQKYFAVEQVGPSGARPGVAVEHAGLTGARPSSDSPDGQDQLAPHFVAVLNMDSDEKGLIRQGHERVLAARFTDAEFFWSADQHLSLRERFDKGMLEQVTYHARLGTYGDKVRRMQDLANYLLSALEMTPQQGEHVRQAVELCKCDLTTQMVQEFTELQGIVGGLYAREQGEPLEVADAIYDHYLPQGAGDRCPRSLVGAVVSLADKFDSVAAGFQAGLEPTGSSDPFALRRAGNGIVKLAVEVLPGLDLTNLANQTFHAQPASAGVQSVPIGTGLGRKVDDFLRERLEFYFRETAGLRYDAVRAVLRPTKIFPDLVPSAALSRARALERVRDSEDFMALATAAKRTRNIRKSADAADIVEGQADPALFVEEPERELYAAYQSLGRRIAELSGSADFEEAFRLMATIRPHVDRFFDKVLVMTEDATLRRNRLKLLLRLNEDAFTSLADLAEIVVESR